MNIAIITPWYEHRDLWDDYQQVIGASDHDELWIVDNGSTPPLSFATLRLESNEGFCGGSNAGLHAATADIIIFLNNDVGLVDRDWFYKLLQAVEPGALVGPRMRRDPHTVIDGKVMPYLDGWCLAGYRDELLDIGGWDTTLDEPGYFSDNLLCLEARARGMRLIEAPIGLHHKCNQTVLDNVEKAKNSTMANRDRYIERARELMAVPA